MPKRAFTLIELLVVITIIGFLVVSVMLGLNSIRSKSRDAKRVADIRQIQNALEIYRNDHDTYPSSLSSGSPLVSQDGSTTYISRVPSAPSAESNCSGNNDYTYDTQENETSYTLSFCLGNQVGNNPVGYNVAMPSGIVAQSAPAAPNTGADGDVTISGSINITTTNSIAGRTCADGGDAVKYSVSSVTSNSTTLTSSPSSGCLANNDFVILINIKGSTSTANSANVGNYEILQVSNVSGATVTFTGNKVNNYGDTGGDTNIGSASTTQKVLLQRVPYYSSLTINNGATLTGSTWAGTNQNEGVLAIKVSGNLTNNGTITMSGLGYRGGAVRTTVNQTGFQGESYIDGNAAGTARYYGAGGGGQGGGSAVVLSGGGGAYGANGVTATYSAQNGGVGGLAYGQASLSSLYLGSGGGGGGVYSGPCATTGSGGKGGGIILLLVDGTLTTDSGYIYNNGANGGVPASDPDCGGGGGGGGGSIKISASSLTLGTNRITATAGTGSGGEPNNWHTGGNGAVGRIAISGTVTGTTNPTYTSY